MYERILKLVITYFEELIDDPDIPVEPESDLMDDLELSSLELLHAMVYLETEAYITIPMKYIKKILTVADVAQVICDVLQEKVLSEK